MQPSLRYYKNWIVDQLTGYKHDKRVEQNASSEILYGKGAGKRRRERHHWDKISALQMAVTAARRAPSRRKQVDESTRTDNIVLFRDMTWNQVQEHRKKVAQDKSSNKRKRARYRRKR